MNSKQIIFIFTLIFIFVFVQIIDIFNQPLHQESNSSIASDTKLKNTEFIIDNDFDLVKKNLTLNYTFELNDKNTKNLKITMEKEYWVKCHLMQR